MYWPANVERVTRGVRRQVMVGMGMNHGPANVGRAAHGARRQAMTGMGMIHGPANAERATRGVRKQVTNGVRNGLANVLIRGASDLLGVNKPSRKNCFQGDCGPMMPAVRQRSGGRRRRKRGPGEAVMYICHIALRYASGKLARNCW